MFRRFALASVVVLTAIVAHGDTLPLGIGRSVDEAALAARAISVAPSGVGLPSGRGSARQGRAIYDTKCGGCHGAKGEGIGDNPALVGGSESLASAQPLYTVGSYWPYATTVWDYINRAMPYTDAGTLTPDEVYAVTAYSCSSTASCPSGRRLIARHCRMSRCPIGTGSSTTRAPM